MEIKTSEILAKTRRIEIRTTRLVTELFGGRYHSTFKGRGVEFADVREYVPGDDVRTIHWNITARLNQPYVKRFTEERELTILIAVDVSASTAFGTRSKLKSELAAELVSVLTFAALKNNDKVGLMLFSDRVENYIPPRKSRRHALRLVRETLGHKSDHTGTNIKEALEYLNRVQKKRAIVFIISDFLDDDFEHRLRLTQKHHDTIAFVLEDAMEKEWPAIGRILVEDAEGGERHLVPGGKTFRDLFARQANEWRDRREKIFAKTNLDRVRFQTDKDYVRPLLTFFHERTRKRR